MKKIFYTPVRRNHIIGPVGVGSILVSRSSVTVLATGLPEWTANLKGRGTNEHERRKDRVETMRGFEIHDYALEALFGVSRFIEPPVIEDEDLSPYSWFVPAVRFPLAEACTNNFCRTMYTRTPDSPSQGRCTRAECQRSYKSQRVTQQVPLVLCCPNGHLDEVDWIGEVHGDSLCNHPDMIYRDSGEITRPTVECRTCKLKKIFLPNSGSSNWKTKCSGNRPWLPSQAAEKCDREMELLQRTSTQVYFPDVRSSLHLPVPDGLSQNIITWLEEDTVASAFVHADGSDAIIDALYDRTQVIFEGLTKETLQKHVSHLRSGRELAVNAGRKTELEALKSGKRGFETADGLPLLDPELIPTDRFSSSWIGPDKLINSVVAVHRLAETRVLSGFTRMTPPLVSRDTKEGYEQMWGHTIHTASEDNKWLPAHRVFGEGIFVELNQDHVNTWLGKTVGAFTPEDLRGQILTQQFFLAHTLAHLLINVVALECGYPVASIRDRIYDEDGTLGFLIYTAAGDSMGTMGGLVELARPGRFEKMLERALSNGAWCTLDPICLSPLEHDIEATRGACHQCCYLPETSCEWFNHALDRATLTGRGSAPGILDFAKT